MNNKPVMLITSNDTQDGRFTIQGIRVTCLIRTEAANILNLGSTLHFQFMMSDKPYLAAVIGLNKIDEDWVELIAVFCEKKE